MKYTKIMLGGLVALTATAYAMPTQEQTKKVEPLVQDLMRDDQAALKSGKKTRVEVAESAMALAGQADSEAAKLLLMKGAFNLYVRAGEFDKAIETLQSLQVAIPDMPPDNMVKIIESSLRVVSRKNGGQLYRLLDETKTRMRYTNEAASLEKSVKRNPADRTLRLKLAEHYAYLGKWDLALENFAAADGKVGAIAKSERGGEAATEKIADFWWNYPAGKPEELVKCFRAHAAKLYESAIAAGTISGLNKVQAERRIEEAKEFGENIFEMPNTGDGLYCIIDLSGGADATKFPVSYLKSLPPNGLTDEYKTTKLILRRIEPGSFDAGLGKKFRITKPYYIGVFEVTSTQYGLVCGRNIYNSALPETRVSWLDLRGSQRGNAWPKSFDVDDDSFMGRIRAKTGLVIDLPTEVQWEYACRAGTKSIYNNGGDKESDLFEVGVCKENKKGDGPVKVGSYKPNKWGLYDMHGNVWEWCLDRGKSGWDMFDWSKEPKETFVDPRGPESGTWHFVRGGGVGWKANWCGSSKRHCTKESDRHGDGGFRIVIQSEAYFKGVATATKQSATAKSSTGARQVAQCAKVQLWDGGPYWADMNIGAKRPWECGYYFWWGDTVGYKRENDAWVASDGSLSGFKFGEAITPTYDRPLEILQNEGWITVDNELGSKHDAAQAHWGGEWRLPTQQELEELKNRCDWKWTTMKGINGYVICGRGAYASASIFLPAAGEGYGNALNDVDAKGQYWASVPNAGKFCSWRLELNSSDYVMGKGGRSYGRTVRPVQGFTKSATKR